MIKQHTNVHCTYPCILGFPLFPSQTAPQEWRPLDQGQKCECALNTKGRKDERETEINTKTQPKTNFVLTHITHWKNTHMHISCLTTHLRRPGECCLVSCPWRSKWVTTIWIKGSLLVTCFVTPCSGHELSLTLGHSISKHVASQLTVASNCVLCNC